MKGMKCPLVFSLLFLVCTASVLAQSFVWTGTNNNDWNNAGNWTPSGIPGNGDVVEINSGTPSLAAGSVNLNGLTINGGSLTVSNSASLTLSGTSAINTGGTLLLNGTLSLQTTLTNNGTINQQGNLSFGMNARLNNQANLRIEDDSDIPYTSLNNQGIFNQGTIRKTAGNGTSIISVIVQNDGSVEALRGKLQLMGTASHSGNFGSVAPGNLSFGGGTHTLVGGNVIFGSGFTSVDGAELLISGNVSAGTMKISQGKIFGNGSLSITGDFQWLGGDLGDPSYPMGSISNGGNGLINGGDILRGHFINTGTLNWTSGNWTMGTNGLLSNRGNFNMFSDGDILFTGSPTGINNEQSMTKSGGSGAAQLFVFVDNVGSIHAQSGEISFNLGGVNRGHINISTAAAVSASTGNFTNSTRGVILGGGELKISVSFTNEGMIEPGNSLGSLTMTQDPGGSITFTDSAITRMEIGGLTMGSQYDHLILDGTFSLGGTLELIPMNSFTPAVGDTFELIDYNNIGSSTFDQVMGCTGSQDSRFQLIDNGSAIFVTLISQASVTNLSEEICQGDSLLIFGEYQSIAGEYVDTLQNVLGCDSIVRTSLSVNAVDTAVSQSGPQLTAQATDASFQWIDCGSGMAISGETSASFTATVNGLYAVVVTNSSTGCSDNSACYEVTGVSNEELAALKLLKLYPNPNQGTFVVELPDRHSFHSLRVYNIQGKEVHRQSFDKLNQVDVQLDGRAGLYILELLSIDGDRIRQRFILHAQ